MRFPSIEDEQREISDAVDWGKFANVRFEVNCSFSCSLCSILLVKQGS